MLTRYLEKQVKKDLAKKMVFIGGPRQVGKTTLAKALLGKSGSYMSWDIPENRDQILRRELPETNIIAFDEIHKYRLWRNYLKGLFDAGYAGKHILVTGSARLDFYRYGGDSLQGRYHYLRLFPLSVAELGITDTKGLNELLTLGGFPEPFFSSSETEARRWSREYRTRLVREDLVSLERVVDVSRVEHLMLRLPDLVASPLSINSLREDIQVSHKALSQWLDILERLYAIFRLPPFGAPKIRAVKKEQKHYHFDWTVVPDSAKRFENMVALHLLKYTAFKEDSEGLDMELRYFRDVDGREVDFVVCAGGKPIYFIECKWSDGEISKGLKYLKSRFPDTEAYQISFDGKKDYRSPEGIRVCPATGFLALFT